ncbi:MAG: lipopolysaccharide kinase InaA family protein, partial [Kiritimatiellia bacterium]|nr:lipopolysaccharide kinase InaA family protein [Kiritimatiellia bacterium]
MREARITNPIQDPAVHIVEGRRIVLAPGVERDTWLDRLARLDESLAGAKRVHASHSALVDVVEWDGVATAIKRVPSRTALQHMGDRYRGSPARRALECGIYLQQHGIGTPRPIAAVEGGDDGAAAGGLLVTEWLGTHVSFKDCLVALLSEGGEAPEIVALLRVVAESIRAMHEAGFVHRDLGNQNILVCREEGRFHSVALIDLNRGRIRRSVSLQERALDLSRIYLPSDLRRIFQEIYFDAPPPAAFRRAEAARRLRFAVHTGTRKFRHPLRTWRNRNKQQDDYPPPRDLWIWDPRSVQAVAALRGKDRRRLMSKRDWLDILLASARSALPVQREAKQLLDNAFQAPVEMAGRIGIAISDTPATATFEDGCLVELGPLHVLARFYAHQSEVEWKATARRLTHLHSTGHSISLVLVQNRRAVKDLSRWRAFVAFVLERVGGIATDIQVGQAVNRTKWGVWSSRDYAGLVRTAAEVARAYPDVKLLGPAVIDFEPHYLAGMLAALPDGLTLNGVGHLLYVDRRGAPENRQGRYDTLGKLAILRAIARLAPQTDDRLVITETNWPLADTGIWSPICSPYLYKGQAVAGGVDELTYGTYMIRYLLIALCSGLAERVCWWRLCAHGFGLVDDKDPEHPRKRPAYEMLLHFVRQVGQATFTHRPDTPSGVHAYSFSGGPSGSFTIAYVEKNAGSRRLELPFRQALDACGRTIESFGGELPADG